MASVTQRIKAVKQPRGGYINPKELEVVELSDNIELNTEENIHSSLVGIAVDYLTRFCIGATKKDAFKISLIGASRINEEKNANRLLDKITGLNDESIINACKLAGYDVCCRGSITAYKPVQEIVPDNDTITNITTMVNRSLNFINQYGPIIKDGFTFEGGYTDLVSTGDGDFLTEKTLWDFKVSTSNPTNKHTLQLLMYYIMGTHSTNPEFNTIENLGIYNPRLNKIYTIKIGNIAPSIIDEVSSAVIGY